MKKLLNIRFILFYVFTIISVSGFSQINPQIKLDFINSIYVYDHNSYNVQPKIINGGLFNVGGEIKKKYRLFAGLGYRNIIIDQMDLGYNSNIKYICLNIDYRYEFFSRELISLEINTGFKFNPIIGIDPFISTTKPLSENNLRRYHQAPHYAILGTSINLFQDEDISAAIFYEFWYPFRKEWSVSWNGAPNLYHNLGISIFFRLYEKY